MAVTEYTETRLEKRQNPAIMCTPSQSDARRDVIASRLVDLILLRLADFGLRLLTARF